MSLWPWRARRKLLDLADEQHETARAGAGRPDPADGAQVALRQLCLALGREHFRDVEHLRKRRALGDLVLRGLQEVLADDEPVALAGHALRPAIEPGFLPEVVQRCFERELGGVRLDAVALTRSGRRRRFPAGARETEAEPQDGDAGISILLDGAPDHIPEARELWGASYDSHPGSCWAPVPGMRLGMNWPATRATYMGAPGSRQRQSGRIRRAWASARAGPSWGSLALKVASPT